jgi:hypothetical protein
MRLWAACAVLIAGCTSDKPVPCVDQATCDPLGAICVGGSCKKPSELDLSLTMDLSTPDLTGACADSTACAAATAPICDPASHVCRACMDDCPAATPVCSTSGACVQCASDPDCDATQQICDPSGICVACAHHTDCATGVCDDGKCALVTDIAHVDNQLPCAGGDGSALHPYCAIGAAITAKKRYLLVAASAVAYAPVSIPLNYPSSISIIGPGRLATPSAAVVAAGGPALTTSQRSTTTLTLDGMELRGDTTTAVALLQAPSAPAIVIKSSLLDQSGGDGVVSTGPLTIDDCVVTGHKGVAIDGGGPTTIITRSTIVLSARGVHIGGATFTIENCIVSSNGMSSATGGAFDLGSATGTFRFNTVALNTSTDPTIAGGIVSCANTVVVESSIFYMNQKSSTHGTQVYGCNLSHSIVDTSDSTFGAIVATPTFGSGLHLAPNDAANLACCVDKVMSGPATDFDGDARPKGAGYDIGADEVQ